METVPQAGINPYAEQTDENLVSNSDAAIVTVGSLPYAGYEMRKVLIASLLFLLLGCLLVLLAERK